MTSGTTLKRVFLADLSWLLIVSMVALAAGIAIDQAFRRPSLGLSYQSVAQRAAAALPESIEQLGMEEVDDFITRSSGIIVDARPRVFYEMGHLPDARSLSREEFERDFAAMEADLRSSGKPILVYCTDVDCEDGAIVARALQAKGVRPIALFPGGFAEWESSGRQVEESQ